MAAPRSWLRPGPEYTKIRHGLEMAMQSLHAAALVNARLQIESLSDDAVLKQLDLKL